MSAHKKIHLPADLFLVAVILLLAGLLRYEWIVAAHPWQTVQQFRDQYIYSDMLQYWSGAQMFWTPGAHWSYADLLFPPGTGTFFALVLGPQMDRLVLWQCVQWILSMSIVLGTGALASLLHGRRAGVIALLITAFSFPLFDYSAYMLSETPFTCVLLGAVLCVAMAYKTKHALWLLGAGALFALSATFKSIGLLAGLLMLPVMLFPFWNKHLLTRTRCAALFCAGLVSVLLPVSFVVSQRNGGFLLLSHDVLRIAIANHGNILGTEAHLPDGGQYNVTSPVSLQKNFQEVRVFTVGKDDIIAQNIAWMRAHPLQAATDVVIRTTDMVYGTLPFPTVASPFKSLLSLSQLVMLFFVYLPAAAWAAKLRKRFSARERAKSLILLLPLTSLLVTAVIAATEPRYLHPFVPLLIVCASMWYKQLFSLKDSDVVAMENAVERALVAITG